jgi:hypothetical protein
MGAVSRRSAAMLGELALFAVIVVVVAVVGVVLGILVAPRLTRYAAREDPSDGDDRDD